MSADDLMDDMWTYSFIILYVDSVCLCKLCGLWWTISTIKTFFSTFSILYRQRVYIYYIIFANIHFPSQHITIDSTASFPSDVQNGAVHYVNHGASIICISLVRGGLRSADTYHLRHAVLECKYQPSVHEVALYVFKKNAYYALKYIFC